MQTALLVIDVQESFRQRPSWRHVDNPDIADRVNTLVAAARAAGDLVMWVLHTEPGTGGVFDPASGHVRLMPEVDHRADEPVLTKTSYNAFTTTNLQQLLTQHGVRALRTCGIRTEQCVETTTRLAHDLGYTVTFVTDATATFPIPHWDAPDDLDDPRTLPAAAVRARTEYALADRFATIATVADVVGTMTGS